MMNRTFGKKGEGVRRQYSRQGNTSWGGLGALGKHNKGRVLRELKISYAWCAESWGKRAAC